MCALAAQQEVRFSGFPLAPICSGLRWSLSPHPTRCPVPSLPRPASPAEVSCVEQTPQRSCHLPHPCQPQWHHDLPPLPLMPPSRTFPAGPHCPLVILDPNLALALTPHVPHLRALLSGDSHLSDPAASPSPTARRPASPSHLLNLPLPDRPQVRSASVRAGHVGESCGKVECRSHSGAP